MKNVGYYNGTYGPLEEMTVPMLDRAVYFGDGVYDVVCCVNHAFYALDDHLDRFYRSVEKLCLPFTLSRAELTKVLRHAAELADGDGSLTVYWQASRGTALRDHTFPESSVSANLMAMVVPDPLTPIRRHFRAVTAEDTRYYLCNIKTLNLIPNVLGAQKAKEAGCAETIFHRGDVVTECAHSNVSILKDGVFRTAPLNNLILPGTERKHLLSLSDGLGIPVREQAFTVREMMEADEVVFHSTGTLCNALDEIDGQKVGGHAPELLQRLQNAAVARFEQETGIRFSDYAV